MASLFCVSRRLTDLQSLRNRTEHMLFGLFGGNTRGLGPRGPAPSLAVGTPCDRLCFRISVLPDFAGHLFPVWAPGGYRNGNEVMTMTGPEPTPVPPSEKLRAQTGACFPLGSRRQVVSLPRASRWKSPMTRVSFRRPRDQSGASEGPVRRFLRPPASGGSSTRHLAVAMSFSRSGMLNLP